MILPHVIRRALAGDWAYLRFLVWQRWHRVDFSAASVAELGLPDGSHDHMHSGGPDLLRVLDTLTITPADRCLDLGSGKGASTFTLATRFAQVVGIELSPALVAVAQRNQRRLGVSNVLFVAVDARAYRDFDAFSHVYLFNPFSDAILQAVIAEIGASLQRHPRAFTVIYKHFQTPTVDFPGFTCEVIRLPRSHAFYVYRFGSMRID